MDLVKLYCDTCAGPRRFERPPCPDDHGADCPEWACVSCGDAVLIGVFPVRLARVVTRRRATRPARRAA